MIHEIIQALERGKYREVELSRRKFLHISGIAGGVLLSPTFTAKLARAQLRRRIKGKPITVVCAQAQDPITMDARQHTDTVTANVVDNPMFDYLIYRESEKMTLVPGLAERWELKDDRTMRFYLRKGVKFHNGKEMTAEDIAHALESMKDPEFLKVSPGKRWKSYAKAWVDNEKPMTVVDRYTVDLNMTKTYPLAEARCAGSIGMAVNKEYDLSVGYDKFGRSPIATGIFKFVEWERDVKVVQEAHDDYFRGRSPIDRLIWRKIPEDSARIAALKTGEIDLITNVAYHQLPSIERAPGVKVDKRRGLRVMYIGMNTFSTPLNDVRVRKAINYAIDVDLIIEKILDGHGVKVPGPYGEFVWPGIPEGVEGYPYDPEKAKKLLAEAGYPNGFSKIHTSKGDTPDKGVPRDKEMDLIFHSPKGRYPLDFEVSQAIVGMLEKVGIKARLVVDEWSNFLEKYYGAKETGLYLLGWGNSLADAEGILPTLFASYGRGWYLKDDKIDELVRIGASTFDRKVRKKAYDEVYKYIVDQAYWGFLYDVVWAWGSSEDLLWIPRADETVDARTFRVKEA